MGGLCGFKFLEKWLKTGIINIKGRDKEQQRRKEKEECRSKQQRRGLRDSETQRLGALAAFVISLHRNVRPV